MSARHHGTLLAVIALLALAACLTGPSRADEAPHGATLADYQKAVAAKRPMMVEFSATWCGPCNQVKPVLDALEPKWKDRVAFIRFDIDTPDGQKMAEEKHVTAVPYFMFIDASGKVVSSPMGAMSSTELEKHLGAIAK